MIVATVGTVHAFDLLPYYLKHYRDLGVERFLVACCPDEMDPSGDLTRFLDAQADVVTVDLPSSFRRSRLVGMVEEETRASWTTASDWIVPADLDELNQYPDELHALVRELEAGGFTHVMGEMRDRLAPNGALPELAPFDQGRSIWDQFPLESDVTKKIVGGRTDKVLLSRGNLPLGLGHHQMRDNLMPFPQRGVAHHFKWRTGLLKVLAWRIDNELGARLPWSRESIRLAEYLQLHGRILLDDVDAVIGWRPDINKIDRPQPSQVP